MNSRFARAVLVLLMLIVAACGKGDSPPGAPTGVTAIAGDSRVVVSWAGDGGATYWIFSAADPTINLQNWTALTGAKVLTGAISPQAVINLINGTTYYFLVNGRNTGGQGGPANGAVAATPRPAGAAWTTGALFTAFNLNSIGANILTTTPPTGTFYTVGAGGVLFSSPDGLVWTAVNSTTANDLNSILFANSRFLFAGTNGTIASSNDGNLWQVQPTGTTSELKAIGAIGGTYVVIGANGTILTSGDAQNWALRASGTTQTLYALVFGNNRMVAVGAGGTILTSTDGSNWQALTSPTSADLKGIAFKTDSVTGLFTFVAVGSQGTILSSPDGLTWTVASSGSSSDLRAVTWASQFVAVGAGGAVVTSVDAVTWVAGASGTTSDLNSLVFGLNQYIAVGAGGSNQIAR